VRLIPPHYAKPFVKRGKNDHLDAEAICEGALRPGMTFVPVKSAETQANATILSMRELLAKQQTQAINALRVYANESGAGAAKGTSNGPHRKLLAGNANIHFTPARRAALLPL
jgi:transposase